MPINVISSPDFGTANATRQYKALPHLCLSRKRRNATKDFDANKSFQLFQDYFIPKFVDGTLCQNLNGFNQNNLVSRLEISAFPIGDKTSPPNPFVFLANDAVSPEMRDELIEVARSEHWIKGVRGGKETFLGQPPQNQLIHHLSPISLSWESTGPEARNTCIPSC
jgi:hypothetical protein